jgi:hypothetical protein
MAYVQHGVLSQSGLTAMAKQYTFNRLLSWNVLVEPQTAAPALKLKTVSSNL